MPSKWFYLHIPLLIISYVLLLAAAVVRVTAVLAVHGVASSAGRSSAALARAETIVGRWEGRFN